MASSYDKRVYQILLGFVVALLVLGTVVYHFVEDFSWVDAYYFSVVTLATVGYGDLTPHTTFGKLFTTFYILSGVGIITAFVSVKLQRRAAIYSKRHGGTPEQTEKEN